MTEEKPSELLTLMTAFVRQKYKKYIFYGVIICDKHSSIVSIKVDIIYDDQRKNVGTINTCDKNSSIINIKKVISDSHEAIKNGKIFWRENSLLAFHICDDIYPLQLNFFRNFSN